MNAYLIADIKIVDPAMYQQYIEKAESIVLKYGGRYLVRGGKSFPLSGNWEPERILVMEFESMTALQTCFNSVEYLAIASLRTESTRSRSIIIEGMSY